VIIAESYGDAFKDGNGRKIEGYTTFDLLAGVAWIGDRYSE